MKLYRVIGDYRNPSDPSDLGSTCTMWLPTKKAADEFVKQFAWLSGPDIDPVALPSTAARMAEFLSDVAGSM